MVVPKGSTDAVGAFDAQVMNPTWLLRDERTFSGDRRGEE